MSNDAIRTEIQLLMVSGKVPTLIDCDEGCIRLQFYLHEHPSGETRSGRAIAYHVQRLDISNISNPSGLLVSDSAQILRQWTLLRILSARRQGATLKDLAAESGVSTKTIQRDLNLLKRLAFPISETAGEYGRKHWKMDGSNGVPQPGFTLEEVAALYLGRQFVEGLAGTFFWSGANSAFRKIQATLGEPAVRHLSKLASAMYFKSHALSDYSQRAELIDQLMIAIEERRLTVITYQSLRTTEPVTLYDIHPYVLVHHRGALYVIGWSKDHGEERVFKIDRISAVDVLQLQFERPTDFHPEKLLEHSFGIFASDGPPQTVRVWFNAAVVRILGERRFHPSQTLTAQPDGSVIAEYQLASFEEFTSWVLSFGPHAAVLAPEELKHTIFQRLSEAISMYDSGRVGPDASAWTKNTNAQNRIRVKP